MTFDFAEVFTVAARRAVPSVLARKLMFSFDCSGATVTIEGDPAALQRACHRMFLAVVGALRTGFVTLTASADSVGAGRIRLQVWAGGIGRLEASAIEPKLRTDLGLEPMSSAEPPWRAQGHWPDIGGRIHLHADPAEGVLLTLETEVAGHWDSSTENVSAEGAHAWLVNVSPVMGASWTRRFTRMGWAVSKFDSYAAAAAQLAGQPQAARPSIVVVVESGDPLTDGVASLPELFPRWTRLIYAVPAGSATLRHPGSVTGYEVNVFPFSPMQMEQFVSEMESQDAPSEQTLPMPMVSGQMAQVLLVDDSPVNLIVGRALLESLGYLVCTASDGQHAIEACRTRAAPALVLMDVDMPTMGGIEATRSLRSLQRQGEIPPFQIVGFTAAWTDGLRQQCLDAGMDECLPKPLEPHVLAPHLRRVVTMA
jgi:CheY-like chemotaxis protein